MKNITKLDLERLAVCFRNAPNSPNHRSADTWNTFEKVGGRAAILYGMYLATPERSRWKKSDLAYDIASALDSAASHWDASK